MRIIKPSTNVISFGKARFGVKRPANSFVGVLDGLAATPYLAYSTRRLSSDYTSFCMRVQNTITSTFYNISFGPDGWADFSALNQAQLHIITHWYDQSGNGRNGVQLGGNQMPAIGFNLLNSRPVVQLYSGGAVRYCNLGNLSALTAGEMLYVTRNGADPSTGDGVGRSWQLGTSGDSDHIPYTDGTVYDDFGSTARPAAGNPATSLASWHLYNVYSATNDFGININTTSLFTTATNTVGFPASGYLKGNGDGRDAAEVFLFSAKLTGGDRTALAADINTAFTLF